MFGTTWSCVVHCLVFKIKPFIFKIMTNEEVVSLDGPHPVVVQAAGKTVLVVAKLPVALQVFKDKLHSMQERERAAVEENGRHLVRPPEVPPSRTLGSSQDPLHSRPF